MTNISFDPSGRPPQSLLARIVGILVGVVALAVVFMFSVVVFIGIAIAGLAFWGYFWWKTRALRRQMQEQMRAQGFDAPGRDVPDAADVIEGEAVRLDEDRNRLN